MTGPAQTLGDAAPRGAPARLTALDAWRGLTVLLMLLVNNASLGSRTPAQLMHAPLGGVTLTDMVFPWFLFCAGAALPFSHAAAQRSGVRPGARLGRLVSRTALLYLVGAGLTSVTEHRFTLGLGVLQLIALSTLLASLVVGARAWVQAALALALLGGYGLFLSLAAHAGGVGVVSETSHPLLAVNAWLGPLGLRGLPSVIPAAALVMLGSLAGRLLQQGSTGTIARLLALGTALVLTGAATGQLDALPLSKALWTPPYVLLAAGLGTLGLLGMYGLADSGRVAWGRRVLSPLTMPGRNALAGYVLPIVVKVWVLQAWTVTWTGEETSMQRALLLLAQQGLGPWWGGWLYTLGYVLAAWLALAWLARRGLIWKL
ncbi:MULTISPECIES: heparan-alpha-glucosaminide N-acetyltransferase domain-containing protein [Deinococcus]|uniref:Heparan-alpha-glucosaminide N-acetyltransferase domain-containing protein n=1 Tax=Deinococcus rufus TaxID=2136097 RepID=A0ABV7Z7B2_9DEIO|nr:heparan-alpha-glucosaminide N-acetyltransferase domain-containing protein [Deinococcus sp. AB2017081]WQE97206.1 heparan-alpha-glucosaminide N-acetyltransferase domain-containing protein [Deinococcus sp. AB2017081]